MRAGTAKRIFDVTLATLLLAALSPILGACAFAVRLADGQPILFRQERVGRGGQRFLLLKFRSMQPGGGPEITTAGDARITRLGRFLRRLKLDELPQLWNVLLGDMSLVGPRPEVPAYVARHERAYRAISDLRPGMTDWASLIFRDEEQLLREHDPTPGFYERALLPRKLALSRLYRRRRSVPLDLCLVFATACAVIGLGGMTDAVLGRNRVARARRFR